MSDIDRRFFIDGEKYIADVTGFFDTRSRKLIIYRDKGVLNHPYTWMRARHIVYSLICIATIAGLGYLAFSHTLFWLVAMIVPLVFLRASMKVLANNKRVLWKDSYSLREPVLIMRLLTSTLPLNDFRKKCLNDADMDMFSLVMGAFQNGNGGVVMDSLERMNALNPWREEGEYDHYLGVIHQHYMGKMGNIDELETEMNAEGMGRISHIGNEKYGWMILSGDTMRMKKVEEDNKGKMAVVSFLLSMILIGMLLITIFSDNTTAVTLACVGGAISVGGLAFSLKRFINGPRDSNEVYSIDLSTPLFGDVDGVVAHENYKVINNALRHDNSVAVVEALKEMSSINPVQYSDVYAQFAQVIKVYSDDVDRMDREKMMVDMEEVERKEIERKAREEYDFEAQYNSKKVIAEEMVNMAHIMTGNVHLDDVEKE